jgi:phosphate starvation-inducible PhoH-like protein
MVTKRLFLKNSEEVINMLGTQDENLRALEKSYGVQIFLRQGAHAGDFSLVVRGPAGKVDNTIAELESMKEKRREAPQSDEKFFARAHHHAHGEVDSDVIYVTHQGKHVRTKTKHQKLYEEGIRKHDVVILIGPAGTGKTFLSVACALRALQEGRVNRIVITRPVVEAGERLGFLPGDLYEKINPYLKPLYDAFYFMLGAERFKFMREDETVEIVPLAYMRGRTLDNAFIILDEAQNTTPEQMKMLLTRMGIGSKITVTGDITQIDLDNKKRSGLVVLKDVLAGVEAVKFIHFTEEDVVRHDIVKEIIRAYEKWESQ